MITAKAFAAQSAVWHRATPTLEQFTRWANTSVKYIGAPVGHSGAGHRSSLITESAFEAAAARKSSVTPDQQESARIALAHLPDQDARAPDLDFEERATAIRLQRNILNFLEWRTTGTPEFRPSFPGCGIVQDTQGDIVVGSHLIEVKAVQRGFRGIDFRQALTYAALAYAKGLNFNLITLLNPRRSTYYQSSSSGLALDIGAGSWVDLMQDLIQQMTDGFSASN